MSRLSKQKRLAWHDDSGLQSQLLERLKLEVLWSVGVHQLRQHLEPCSSHTQEGKNWTGCDGKGQGMTGWGKIPTAQ